MTVCPNCKQRIPTERYGKRRRFIRQTMVLHALGLCSEESMRRFENKIREILEKRKEGKG